MPLYNFFFEIIHYLIRSVLKARAKAIIFALDDTLRYIPMTTPFQKRNFLCQGTKFISLKTALDGINSNKQEGTNEKT